MKLLASLQHILAYVNSMGEYVESKTFQESTEVHLIDINRLGEDPGLVFSKELVQEGSEQNTEGSQLHL